MKHKYLAALLLGSFVFNNIQAQIFNFDDNSLSDTTGQVSLVPFNIFGSGQVPPPAAGSIEASEGVLRMSATHFGMGTSFDPSILGTILGPTRIGVINPTPYQDFKVSVLVTDAGTLGDTGFNPFILLGARLSNVGPGTTAGYAVQLGFASDGKRSIGLVKIVNEQPATIKINGGKIDGFSFPHTEQSQYLITFTGMGPVLTVEFDDLSTDAPALVFSVVDADFSAGATGILLAAPVQIPEQSVTAMVDNFTAGPAPVLPEAPALTIAQAVKLTWPIIEGNFQLESATELLGAWRKVDAPVFEMDGTLQATVVVDEVNRYFRLRPIE